MTSAVINRIITCLAALSIVPAPAHSQTQNAQGAGQIELRELPKAGPDGFVTIIGGDDLRVWKGLADYWYARDGVIGGRETREDSKQTFLIFPYRLQDFELRLKYKFLSPEGNSGIQFRSKVLDPQTYRVGGYQADFDATGKFDGSIYDEAGVVGGRATLSDRGDRTTWDAKSQRKAVKIADSQQLSGVIHIGDWNDVKLVARGNHITYSINGHVMTELVDLSPNAAREGVLALQLHQGFTMDVQFKDGKLRKLK